MLSKTLIVCLLAFLCLNLAAATRLDARLAGPDRAEKGQFPYIAFLTYNYDLTNADGTTTTTSEQFTGIIYSNIGVITTANNFDNFPAGATLTIEVGAWDVNQPLTSYTLTPTVVSYTTGDDISGLTGDNVFRPSAYVAGEPANNIAIVRINPSGNNKIEFANAEVSIANFPTSQPIKKEQLVAVAYGNQAPGGATFPFLKYISIELAFANQCDQLLTQNGLNSIDRSIQYCVRSRQIASTNNLFEGICGRDIGGVIVRSRNPTDVSEYYEVVGIITYAGDESTCDSTARVPAVINYLTPFQETFFTPILGDLVTAGNGQDPDQNDNSVRGLFICGDKVVNGVETCDPEDPSTSGCCSENTCNWKRIGKKCGAKGTATCAPERCRYEDADAQTGRVCSATLRKDPTTDC